MVLYNVNEVEYTVVLTQDFRDVFTCISVVAAMLPIVERPNAILKPEFVNIRHFTSH